MTKEPTWSIWKHTAPDGRVWIERRQDSTDGEDPYTLEAYRKAHGLDENGLDKNGSSDEPWITYAGIDSFRKPEKPWKI